MDGMIDDWKEKIKTRQERLEKNPNLVSPRRKLKSNWPRAIKRQQKMLADNEKAIAGIVDRINNVPGVEVAWEQSNGNIRPRRRLTTIF